MERIQLEGVYRVAGILQVVGSVGSDAVFGDLVFSDSGIACRIARES